MKLSLLRARPAILASLVMLTIAPCLQGQAIPAIGAASIKPPYVAGEPVLRGIVHSEGKWLAAISDRTSGNRISWLEENQVFGEFVVKEIGEQGALLVEQQTGRPITLHLQFSTVTKSADGAVAVARVASDSDPGGLSKASALISRPQTGKRDRVVAPALMLAARDGLPEGGGSRAADAAKGNSGAPSADAAGLPPAQSRGPTK